jgi:putative membrane protein
VSLHGADAISRAKRRPSPLAGTILITLAVYGMLGYALSADQPAHLPPLVARALAGFPLAIAVVNASALICLLAGWRAIRAGRATTHRRLMLASAVCISLFLLLYVTRVALGGVKAFPGPPEVRSYVYLPTLTVHIVLSVLSVPLVVHNLLIGLTYGIREIPATHHPRVGRLAVTLWSVSLALGVVVYLMLNVFY